MRRGENSCAQKEGSFTNENRLPCGSLLARDLCEDVMPVERQPYSSRRLTKPPRPSSPVPNSNMEPGSGVLAKV